MASGSWKPSNLLGSGELRSMIQSLTVYLDDVKGIIRANSAEVPPNPKAGWTRYDQDTDQLLTYTSAGSWTPILNTGAWTAYTPSITNGTLGNGTLLGAYVQMGKTIAFRAQVTLGTTSTVASGFRLGIPALAKSGVWQTAQGWAFHNAGSLFFNVWCEIETAGDLVRVFNAANNTLLSATVPFTWAANDILVLEGVYEAN